MATYTNHLNLEKPDTTDKVSPEPFNNNAEILDSEIADLKRYKTTIDDLVLDVSDIQQEISGIGDLLDDLNGEVI